MKKMPMTSVTSGTGIEVLPDLYCFNVQIVNIAFIGNPRESNEFVLVDAGMPDSESMIMEAAKERFGENAVCKAIILTHGHFDHVGALKGLLKKWDVPVYAHSLEKPFLSGESSYPPPNTDADSGLVAKMSSMFPRHSINISSHLNILPEDGAIPVLPGWRAIHTPGHTPGHISLFRDSDKALISGDAFINVEQEKLYEVMTQKQEIHGPPQYFTVDWQAAWDSVKTLAGLKPQVAVVGHGLPLADDELTTNLDKLARDFGATEIPENKK
ncbi:MBL fold metallo-hydrolase [Bacillus sp. SG-1]|uniref:MBL fold metallo-hydrolase n=1 Tax=Bacillus sp. SG-1 TaxID=161544 RepID=UPI0001544CF7|nr:MBL fold metallo-hydrolase [Bacillus sp. SG-1]EDL64259.1 metallo-beta-lactamase family protein [Bacillus sp. SG-1]